MNLVLSKLDTFASALPFLLSLMPVVAAVVVERCAALIR